MATLPELIIKLNLADAQIERLIEETERLRRDLKDCRRLWRRRSCRIISRMFPAARAGIKATRTKPA